MGELQRLKELTERLKDTSSVNDKKEILAQYEDCKSLLSETYDPYQRFYITSSQLKKYHHLSEKIMETPNIYSLLRALSSRMITGHDAINQCNWFIGENIIYEDLIHNIIDRDLKCRVRIKVINKVWPGLIKEFSASLAQRYEDYEHRLDFNKQKWFASRKFDGIRILAIVNQEGEVTFRTRRGHENLTLSNLVPHIRELFPPGYVLDGEICVLDEDGNENFIKAQSELSRKDHIVERPIFKVFDLLSLEEFQKKKSSRILSDRFKELWAFLRDCEPHCPIHMVEQKLIKDESQVKPTLIKAISKGWEGLILRRDTGYKGKRSWDMLKLKNFHEDEYEVLDLVHDNLRFVEAGKEVTRLMLSSVTIEHKGESVSVGSGFTKEQRILYYQNPEKLIGKTITVKYFEESYDKEGKVSLRFPTVKAIYDGKRDK